MTPRLVTAAILAAAVLGGLFLLPPVYAALVLGAFLVVGAWEWAALTGSNTTPARAGFVIAISVAGVALWAMRDNSRVLDSILALGVIWWAVAVATVIAAQRGHTAGSARIARHPLTGACVLLPAWLAVVWLLYNDRAMLVVLFGVIWTADAAAYFVGRRWGRRRLASRLSPGKTWEGAAGGLVFAVAAAAGLSFTVVLSPRARLAFIVVAAVVVVVSIVGDLLESHVKRQAGVKDSGTILPGHGGVMDRIDGFVAAAPVYCAGLIFWVYRL